jgi:uncharacterized protein YrrD
MKHAKENLFHNLLAQKKNDWLNKTSWVSLLEITSFGHAMVLSSLQN